MRRSERGTALILALVVLGLAASVGAALLDRGRSVAAATRHDEAALQALYAAEGGLAHARHALARDAAWPGQTIRVDARDVDVSAEADGEGWRVVVRTQGARIDARLARSPGLPAVVSWRLNRP